MRLYRALSIPLLALFVLAIGHSSQPAWAQSQQLAADSVLEAIKKRGTLKIGMTTFVSLGHARQDRRIDRIRD